MIRGDEERRERRAHRAERRARCAERREARARDREALKRLPRRERLRVWWRMRPLGVTFTVYLAVYLAVATAASLGLIEVLSAWNNGYYELEVTLDNGLTQRGPIDSGPYIYDPNTRELLPASELDLPGDGPYAVFIATGDWGTGSDYVPDGGRTISSLYATVGLVRSGQVQLYDWGLNYNEGYPQEDILEVNSTISADNLARYDELSRKGRAQSVELFESMTGADLEETFGEGLVSNTAYYAASQPPASLMPWILTLATGLAPVLAYGGLGLLTFRRFYRVHIAAPLAELAGAADRIAEQDLDFAIGTVRGRELGRLSETLEHMRASLLEAQRELWRTAESRRCLNAAFAHDLRTPITVLKGTVEMAQMRLRRGDTLDVDALDALSSQVARLERYATSMGGLTKLEDRPVERERLSADVLRGELEHHVAGVVSARGSELDLELASRSESAESIRHDMTVLLDLSLVEEVLDNLLSNACAHAVSSVTFDMMVDAGTLTLVVTDDGPGFTPEALHRGCDPFFSENKSAEHFGLGLNVSSVLCGLHGGEIALTNAETGGARVIATFDVRPEWENAS
ncbi:MAG: HAMP domain-containing sensor histidine kinase [Collinsella aerofaciens]|uniref:HAMP domain-containing sensor histidine kinase n=1 Tax=Collinsella aerofaciens TaxID=74426 RepID=UPI0030CA3010